MADEYPWCRWWNGVRKDDKLKLIAFQSGVPVVTALGAWGLLLDMASSSPQRGRLLLTETRAWMRPHLLAEIGIPEAESLLNGFLDWGLLEQDEQGVFVISQWNKRQPPSDNSTQRQRDYRARKQDQTNNFVTPMSRDNDVTVSPSDIDTELDIHTTNNAGAGETFEDVPEPDGLWDDGLAEDLQAVVNAAAPAAAGDSFADDYKALADQGFDGFPKPKNQRDLKLLPLVKTPAVFTWVSVTFHTPEYDQLPYLVKQLGPNPNREVLATVWEMWRGNGYSPGKITGVLEWYQLRLKDTKWQPTYGQKARASPNGNGAAAKGGRQKANGKQSEFDPDTIGQVL